jgi:DNA ligase-1
MNFNDLQTRIGRKTVGKKITRRCSSGGGSYDLLEWEGKDIRDMVFLSSVEIAGGVWWKW